VLCQFYYSLLHLLCNIATANSHAPWFCLSFQVAMLSYDECEHLHNLSAEKNEEKLFVALSLEYFSALKENARHIRSWKFRTKLTDSLMVSIF
jgi:hypothetical protein